MSEHDPAADSELDATVASTEAPSAPPTRAPPQKISRFEILHQVGAGGMSVVLAAYDPSLDRRVAIKLMRLGAGAEITPRLRREAQAMAKIGHPNVAEVFEVGTHEDQVYIALEFVNGVSLRDWLAAEQRPWRQTLDMVLQAGEGLAAAHAAGLIHRDFKPDNAMVGEDGRLRVLDFGLAVEQGNLETSQPALAAEDASTVSLRLTQSGAILGTPAYMAPEQFAAEPASAASDQFSLCVVLFEALYGERPFQGNDWASLAKAVIAGEVCAPKDRRGVPDAIHAALLRGLSVDARARHATVASLVAGLRDAAPKAPQRSRAGVWLGGAALLAVGAGLAVLTLNPQEQAGCGEAATELETVWGDEARARTQTAFEGSQLGARGAADMIELLDQYASRWNEVAVELCEQNLSAPQADTRDAAADCLDESLDALQAFVARAQGSTDTPLSTDDLTPELPALESCLDADALRARVPPPPAGVASEVEAIHDALGRGPFGEVPPMPAGRGPELVSRAQATGYAPIIIRAELANAVALATKSATSQGDEHEFDAAMSEFRRLHDEAEAAGTHGLALTSAGGVVRLLLVAEATEVDVNLWLDKARAHVAAGGNTAGLQVRLAEIVGRTHAQFGRDAEATEVLSDAVGLARASSDEDLLLRALGAAAGNDFQAGAFQRGLDKTTELYELAEQRFGPEHPQTLNAAGNRGALLAMLGHHEEGVEVLVDLVERIERLRGREDAQLIQAWGNLSAMQFWMGDHEACSATSQQVIDAAERGAAVGDILLATAYGNRALCLVFMDELDTADQLHARALDIVAGGHGWDGIARKGEFDSLYGFALVENRHFEKALPLLESALVARASAPPHQLAETQIALARAITGTQGDVVRAAELMRVAEAALKAAPADPRIADQLATIEAWRAEHLPDNPAPSAG